MPDLARVRRRRAGAATVSVMPSTRQLAEFAATRHDVPGSVLERVRDAFIDTVGVAVAGSDDPAVRILRRVLGPAAPGPALVLPSGSLGEPRYAALLNATAAHALDYDDVSHSVKGHPSTVLVPALLAVAGEGQRGPDLLSAYAVGVQVAAALWSGLGPDHYAKGWHATSTVGVVGAAAAVGNLLRLDETELTAAIGVAASFAAGSRQNFGTMTKPLHAGHAAEWGVTAALLAAEGFTADPTEIEGPLGFLGLLGGGPSSAVTISDAWIVGGDRGLNVKKYPCCYFAHRSLDALLELPALDPDAVEQIEAHVPVGSTSALLHPSPTSPSEARFSGPYALAAAFIDRSLTLDSFTDTAIRRPEVRALMPRVTLTEVEAPPFGAPEWSDGFAVVSVRERSGAVHAARVDIPRGDCRRPLSGNDLRAKFTDCMCHGGRGAQAAATFDHLMGLTTTDRAGDWVVTLGR